MGTEALEKVRDACESFLQTYSEDVSMGLVEQTVGGILENLHDAEVPHHRECTHPIRILLLQGASDVEHFTLILDVRTKKLMLVRVNKSDMHRERIGPHSNPLFDLHIAKRHVRTNIEMLTLTKLRDEYGIDPTRVISGIKTVVEQISFDRALDKTTQPFGHA